MSYLPKNNFDKKRMNNAKRQNRLDLKTRREAWQFTISSENYP